MKYFAVLIPVACTLPAAASKPPALPQVADLRQALGQYQPQMVPAPRQLSAQEREELRRLLREQAPPTPRKNPFPGP